MKKKRLLVIIFTLLFVLSLIFTFSFISANINHECIGKECQICEEIDTCEDFLKAAACTTVAAAAVTAVRKFGIVALPFFGDRVDNSTLISLKVKLSN